MVACGLEAFLFITAFCANTHVAQQLRDFSYWTFDIYRQTPHTTVAEDQVLIPTLLWTLEIGPKESPLSFWNVGPQMERSIAMTAP